MIQTHPYIIYIYIYIYIYLFIYLCVCFINNLGTFFGKSMSCAAYQQTHQVCFYQLCILKCIQHSLPSSLAIQLGNTFIILQVDYCNSLMAGLPKYNLNHIQSILNDAVRLIFSRGLWYSAEVSKTTSHHYCEFGFTVSRCPLTWSVACSSTKRWMVWPQITYLNTVPPEVARITSHHYCEFGFTSSRCSLTWSVACSSTKRWIVWPQITYLNTVPPEVARITSHHWLHWLQVPILTLSVACSSTKRWKVWLQITYLNIVPKLQQNIVLSVSYHPPETVLSFCHSLELRKPENILSRRVVISVEIFKKRLTTYLFR